MFRLLGEEEETKKKAYEDKVVIYGLLLTPSIEG